MKILLTIQVSKTIIWLVDELKVELSCNSQGDKVASQSRLGNATVINNSNISEVCHNKRLSLLSGLTPGILGGFALCHSQPGDQMGRSYCCISRTAAEGKSKLVTCILFLEKFAQRWHVSLLLTICWSKQIFWPHSTQRMGKVIL